MIIEIGLEILMTDSVAMPRLDIPAGSTTVTLTGAQIIFLGVLMIVIASISRKEHSETMKAL